MAGAFFLCVHLSGYEVDRSPAASPRANRYEQHP